MVVIAATDDRSSNLSN